MKEQPSSTDSGPTAPPYHRRVHPRSADQGTQTRQRVFHCVRGVIDLPVGATALDFAYRVHTQVGHRCNGVRINDQIATLDKEIRTGDRVQVLTRKQPSPSRDWLNPNLGYLRTASARQKIRQWFRKQNRDEAIASGRELVDKELARLGVSAANREELAAALHYAKTEDLLPAVGFGDLGTHRVGARALEAERGPHRRPRSAANVTS